MASAILWDEATLAEFATKFEVHPNMIAQWKRLVSECLVEVFSGKANRNEAAG